MPYSLIHGTDPAEIIGNVGDVNYPEYDGGPILRRGEGTWLEYAYSEEVEDEDQTTEIEVYRVDLGSAGKDGARSFLAGLDWVKWEDVASSIGVPKHQLTRRSVYAGEDWVNARAGLLCDVAGYYGWHELDHYPLTLNLPELRERWGMCPVCGSDRIDVGGQCAGPCVWR